MDSGGNIAPWEAFGVANSDPLNNQIFQLYDLTRTSLQRTPRR